MIFVTGDCHSEFQKFSTPAFPEQREMTKEDIVIVCGDFGAVWNADGVSNSEAYWLNWLDEKPFTTVFVDGNHENFDRLNSEFEVVDFHGGIGRVFLFQFRESLFRLAAVRAVLQIEKRDLLHGFLLMVPIRSNRHGQGPAVNS